MACFNPHVFNPHVADYLQRQRPKLRYGLIAVQSPDWSHDGPHCGALAGGFTVFDVVARGVSPVLGEYFEYGDFYIRLRGLMSGLLVTRIAVLAA